MGLIMKTNLSRRSILILAATLLFGVVMFHLASAAAKEDDEKVANWRFKIDTSPDIRIGYSSLSPDGKVLAVGVCVKPKTIGCESTFTAVWDIKEGKLLKILPGYSSQIIKVRFSPRGDRLITNGSDKTGAFSTKESLRVYNTSTFELIDSREPSEVAGMGSNQAISHDGKMEATVSCGSFYQVKYAQYSPPAEVCNATHVRIIDISTNASIKEMDAPGNPATGFGTILGLSSPTHVLFSPDDKYVATGGDGFTVTIFDLSNGKSSNYKLEYEKEGKKPSIFEMKGAIMAFSPDGKLWVNDYKNGPPFSSAKEVTTGATNGMLRFDIAPGPTLKLNKSEKSMISGWDFTQNGKLALCGAGSSLDPSGGSLALCHILNSQPIEPLIFLHLFNEKDWMVFTGDGHFDASFDASAEPTNTIVWKKGKGHVDPAVVFKDLRVPGLFKQTMEEVYTP
jgi:hypothetical protein